MNLYRITKYNPDIRDERGFYTKFEWTSISDIGRTFEDGILTSEEYFRVEAKYIQTVRILLQEKEIPELTVSGLEKPDGPDVMEEYLLTPGEKALFDKITEDSRLASHEVETAARLVLREVLWCKLTCKTIIIEFGYDYYMYARCDELSLEARKQIAEHGLFVERFPEREER